jgi:hypothetical protein
MLFLEDVLYTHGSGEAFGASALDLSQLYAECCAISLIHDRPLGVKHSSARDYKPEC